MNRTNRILGLVAGIVAPAAAALAQAGGAPLPPSRVDVFRALILTNAEGREQFLAGKSPAARQVIEAKLREYEGMTLAEREEKLHSLQLRWQTLQIMRLKPADRDAQLAALPPADRTNVQRRLGPLIILPPTLQQEVLSNKLVLSALMQEDLKAEHANGSTAEEIRKQELLVHFKEFIDLEPSEQNKALSKLTPIEREQMKKTLLPFSSLPKAEREQALEGFRKFAELPEAERAEFLKTAGQWRTMSDHDRRLWRTIVESLRRAKANPPPMPFISRPEEAAPFVATNLPPN